MLSERLRPGCGSCSACSVGDRGEDVVLVVSAQPRRPEVQQASVLHLSSHHQQQPLRIGFRPVAARLCEREEHLHFTTTRYTGVTVHCRTCHVNLQLTMELYTFQLAAHYGTRHVSLQLIMELDTCQNSTRQMQSISRQDRNG